MKVKTLVNALTKIPQDAEVRLNDTHGSPCLFVTCLKDGSIVSLEGEGDVDMRQELEARFENAAKTQEDELDFYTGLLELGITVNMVRKYCSDERAKHMEDFMDAHGLM